MKMDLIQPFINAADAVLAQGLHSPTSMGNLSMEEEAYRRKGVAALIWLTGDIEGRIVFDLDPATAGTRGQQVRRRRITGVRRTGARNGLRTGQSGNWQCGHNSQRSGIPFPRASASPAHVRARSEKQRGHGSAGHLLRN